MKKLLLQLLFIGLCHTPLAAQDILQFLNDQRTAKGIPGIGFAVVAPQNVLTSGVSGYADLSDSSLLSLGARFHLGSNSKAITAWMALHMVKAGKISWETKITDLLPELAASMHKAYRKTTLADLLSHRAMLPAYTAGTDAMPWYRCDLGGTACRLEFSRQVLSQKPVKPEKGKKFAYSNAGYVVVSAMLERVGDSLGFDNLVELYANQTTRGNFKLGWPKQSDEFGARGHLGTDSLYAAPEDLYFLGPVYAAAGNMNGTLFDQAALLQQLLLSLSQQHAEVSRKEAEILLFGLPQYAFGWGHDVKNNGRRAYHDGSAGTFYTRWVLYEDFQRAIIICTNSASPAAIEAVKALQKELEMRYLTD